MTSFARIYCAMMNKIIAHVLVKSLHQASLKLICNLTAGGFSVTLDIKN